jgi:hypothetical protein
LPGSSQLHELFHEGQRTGHLPDRGAIRCGVNTERGGFTRVLAGVFDDQRVLQGSLAELLGNATERYLVRHHECDDDRRWMPRGFAGGVRYLSDLRTMWEVGPD